MTTKRPFPWFWSTVLLAFAVAAWVFAPAWPPHLALESPDATPLFQRAWKAQQILGLVGHQRNGISHDVLLSLLLPNALYHDLSYMVNAALLALALAVYLRGLKLAPAACLAGGVALAFSGYHFTLFCAGHRGYFVMMPYAVFLLALIDRAIDRPRWSQFALMAACVAYAVGHQPDVLLVFVGVAALYALLRAAQALTRADERPLRTARLRGWALGLAVALATLALAGASVLHRTLTVTLAMRDRQIQDAGGTGASATADTPEARAAVDRNAWVFATNWSLPPEDMLEFIAPNVRGYDSYNPQGPYWGRLGQSMDWPTDKRGFVNYRQHTLYLGVLQLLLACYGIGHSFRRRDPHGGDATAPGLRGVTRFWMAIGLAALLLAFGRYTPLYHAFYALPGMSRLRAPVKFLHITELSVAILSAIGLSALLRTAGGKQRTDKPLAVGCMALSGVAALACLFAGVAGIAPEGVLAERLEGLKLPALAPELQALHTAALLRAAGLFALGAFLFGGAAFLSRERWSRTVGWATGAIIALVVLDMGTTARPYVRVLDLRPYTSRNPVSDALQASGGPDGMGVANRLGPLPSNHPVLWPFIRDGFLTSDPPPNHDANWYSVESATHFGEDFLRQWLLWGTRAVLVPPEAMAQLGQNPDFAPLGTFALTRDGWVSVPPEQAQIGVMAFKRWIPTAALYTRWRSVPVEGVWPALTASDLDLTREVVVADGPACPATGPRRPAIAAKLKVPASRTGYRKAVVEVQAAEPGLLVLRERFEGAPRVFATVNGTRRPALRTNAFFWAVPVDQGTSVVTFQPQLDWWILGVHGAGLLLAALALGREISRRTA